MKTVEISRGAYQIVFSEDGEIVSFCCEGSDFCTRNAGCGLFLIRLRDLIGKPVELKAESFRKVEIVCREDGATLHFSQSALFSSVDVFVEVSLRDDGAHWRLRVENLLDVLRVEWCEFPRLPLARKKNEKFLWPIAEGTLLDDLERREKMKFPYSEIEYPMTGEAGFYPGPCAMQFQAYYNEQNGLYMGCHDRSFAPKMIDARTSATTFQPVFRHFVGGSMQMDYDVVLAGFRGDWQDAADRYRNWMESEPETLPVKLADDPGLPQWFKESPVILIYPVRGKGVDHNSLAPNEYFPYTAALPTVDKYRNAWNSRIMALLMHWEGTAPWAPPYVWPAYGGNELLREFTEKLHRNGDLIGLYCSGIGWTQRSCIDRSYSREKEFAEKQLEKEICIGPLGEKYSRVCNYFLSQRLGYDLCPGREFTRETVCSEVTQAAGLGIDYLQYFDQNQGCAAPLCYSREHGHPDLPGAWHTAAMRNLLDSAQQAAGGTLLGCENAAAEPYLGVCRLNDRRSHLAWAAGGTPVPVWSYLFHEYSAGFTGNGVCLALWVRMQESPWFLRYVIALGFCAGDILSVVLKDGGKIHWSWVCLWENPEPEQSVLVSLIGNLNAWRRGRAGKFLVSGRMEKSPEIECGTGVFRMSEELGNAACAAPEVVSSAWSCGKDRALVLVNYHATEKSCRVNFPSRQAGHIVSAKTEHTFDAETLELAVPPLDMLMIEY